VVLQGWRLAFALAYGLQVLAALNQLKGSLEHGGEIAFDPDRLLRSRSSMVPLQRLLPMFYVTIYHFEHHLNYAVPWYDLPRYHRDVHALVPPDLRGEIFNADLLAQLAGHKGPVPRAGDQVMPANRES
jgi:fatty acid desaturase